MTQTQTLVLIVEDDASTREFIARGLAKSGMASVSADSVGQALVRLEERPLPDAMVLDLRLPDANGVVVLRRVRREGLPIRVAVVTGMADAAEYFKAVRFAPDRIFQKPLSLPDLLAWLAEAPPDVD